MMVDNSPLETVLGSFGSGVRTSRRKRHAQNRTTVSRSSLTWYWKIGMFALDDITNDIKILDIAMALESCFFLS